MQFVAKVKGLPFSPFKLRPIVDVVRGKGADQALGWLSTYATKRVRPIRKMIESAVANAKSLQGIESENLWIKEIKVDAGKISRYYKPGVMGRASIQRKRFCHMTVILAPKQTSKGV